MSVSVLTDVKSTWGGKQFANVPTYSEHLDKADKTYVDSGINSLNNKIVIEKTERERSDNAISTKISETVRQLNTTIATKAEKKDLELILSASSLEKVKSSFETLLRDHISKIQDECKQSHALLQKDIEAFDKVAKNANQELALKLTPINNQIQLLYKKVEFLISEISKIGDLKANIETIQNNIYSAKKESEILISRYTLEIQTLSKQSKCLSENECISLINKIVNQQLTIQKKEILAEIQNQNRKKSFWKRIFNLN